MIIQNINKIFRIEKSVGEILDAIAKSVIEIKKILETEVSEHTEKKNASQDVQKTMDFVADEKIFKSLCLQDSIGWITSEEQFEKYEIKTETKKSWGVSYDPLDGSSLLGTNYPVGSIFGIWKIKKEEPEKIHGNQLYVGAYACYGPQLHFVIAIKGQGVCIFQEKEKKFELLKQDIKIKNTSKFFSPGNLRAASRDQKYKSYIDDCIKKEKTLRYSGGLVPDIHQILCRQEGIFTYPPLLPEKPHGVLRWVYECAPMALIIEESKGTAKDHERKNILEKEFSDPHKKSTLFIGSRNEVETALKFIND